MPTVRAAVLLTLALTAVYGELLIYRMNVQSWQSSSHLIRSPTFDIDVPQLEQDSVFSLGGQSPSAWAAWAAERHARRATALAIDHFRPDAIVILGNIMQSGSAYSDAQFKSGTETLQSIVESNLPTITVPGESDIIDPSSIANTLYALQRWQKSFNASLSQHYYLHQYTLTTIDSVSLHGHPHLEQSAGPADAFLMSLRNRLAKAPDFHRAGTGNRVGMAEAGPEIPPLVLFSYFPMHELHADTRRSIVNDLQPRYIFSARDRSTKPSSTNIFPAGVTEMHVPSLMVDFSKWLFSDLGSESGFAVAVLHNRCEPDQADRRSSDFRDATPTHCPGP
ncbi:hypothetical protein CAOG_05245 [Capsaspora owczarzaki ATCC 30864]|uniref:hypothetical protein n=1 Tax=Capsaspora owczarzaki (strain ATCC 30864) TaxID=595528 RepID=UPI0003522F18|nr:hypothetical protein CAOG_05245 [Capsaspora owczarzaki ATCC 30864]|eukprot:XP_004346930.2 hypothetical protein CAOG_05245 [Capsaspora owczarzaki ATCC 30864]